VNLLFHLEKKQVFDDLYLYVVEFDFGSGGG
jgi:hypothetical protein